jgi:hypothetical protein
MPSKKTLLIISAILVLLVSLGLLVWYMMPAKEPATVNTSKTSTKSATTPATTPTVSDEELIKKALVAKTKIPADKIDVTVSQKSGNHAKGLVGAKGEMGGGYFLAFKESDTAWAIVFDGQSTPGCDMVSPYNFPASMVPECLDAAGNPVTR